MKKIITTRKVDDLGRIVIPIEIRKNLKIKKNDSLDISTEGSSILLKKIEETCVFCGTTNHLLKYNNSFVCTKCINKLSKLS